MIPWLVLFFACSGWLTGCASARRGEEALLSRHPIRETRMSTQPEPGYVPSGVWQVRGVDNILYLGGTSHIVPPEQVPFPSPYYAAYADAQIIYVEFDTDLSWWEKLRLMPRMLKWAKAHAGALVPPAGKTLANYLSAETLGQLRQRYGREFDRERVTPVYLLFVHEAGLLQPTGAKREMPSGVEEPFQILARRDGKPLGELDDGDVIDTALLVLDQVVVGWQREIARRGADAVVRNALLNDTSEDEVDWRHGDLAAIARFQEEMRKDSPAIYEKALPDRNRRWMKKLKPLLHGKKNVLVLVGIAHVGGPEGLLTLLSKAGFPAEQLYGVDRPEIGTPVRLGR